MKVVFKESFLKRLESQVDYISKDSPRNARKFKDDLFKQIRDIPSNPYRCRQSIYFNDRTIRDLVFKGYTIVYRITKGSIQVFGFVKYQVSPTD